MTTAPDPAGLLEAYHELCSWTLTLRDPTFVHQHVVDAWAVQQAAAEAKPIAVAFGLAGLCLHLERGLTGRQVQLAHIAMARPRRVWPRFELPSDRGTLTAREVIDAPSGPARLQAIDAWCGAVWTSMGAVQAQVRALLDECGVARAPD